MSFSEKTLDFKAFVIASAKCIACSRSYAHEMYKFQRMHVHKKLLYRSNRTIYCDLALLILKFVLDIIANVFKIWIAEIDATIIRVVLLHLLIRKWWKFLKTKSDVSMIEPKRGAFWCVGYIFFETALISAQDNFSILYLDCVGRLSSGLVIIYRVLFWLVQSMVAFIICSVSCCFSKSEEGCFRDFLSGVFRRPLERTYGTVYKLMRRDCPWWHSYSVCMGTCMRWENIVFVGTCFFLSSAYASSLECLTT